LAPAELVRRAKSNGVELFSLTDHDELDGLSEARTEAQRIDLSFINGVEISVSWGDDQTDHIVGLGFDDGNAALAEGVVRVRSGRDHRARHIAAELDKVGIHGAYEGALRHAGNPALISRAHFARHIVESGHAKDINAVFDYWLAKGKPGYVAHPWATLEEAMAWIHGAGGLTVLAHPGRYRLSKAALADLYATFRDLGGVGIEVISGSHGEDEIREAARVARRYGFLASRGSDFHGPGESWTDLGRLPDLPPDLTPIWSRLV
jgi:predicted metal-dependent phosphoesterase TrpH